jgi:hypothetical protein
MRGPRLLLGIIALGLAFPATSRAQAVDFNFRIYAAGARTPLGQPTLVPGGSVVCDREEPPDLTRLNPTTVVWDDPARVGRVCVYSDPGTGPLASVPSGVSALELTVTQTRGGVESNESNRAPFSKATAREGSVPAVR